MTNRSQFLGRRILSALRNDSILLMPQNLSVAVVLASASTGKAFGLIRETKDGTFYVIDREGNATMYGTFDRAIDAVKQLPGYRKPKQRRQLIKALYHQPKMTGVSMGSFVPGTSI